MHHPKLLEAWKHYTKLYVESVKCFNESNAFLTKSNELTSKANELYAEGVRRMVDSFNLDDAARNLIAEARTLFAESDKYTAKILKLRARSNELFVEADIAWSNAVREAYGKTSMVWRNRDDVKGHDCVLFNEEVYTVEMGRELEVKEILQKIRTKFKNFFVKFHKEVRDKTVSV